MSRTEIESFPALEQLSRAAAGRIAAAIGAAVRRRDEASLVLAGGSTPELTYRLLAAETDIAWQKVHLFWGDERWVAPVDPESNFHLVQRTVLEHIDIPEQNIHSIDFTAGSPEEAAALYDRELKTFLSGQGPLGKRDYFDLTILGMGEDGHTASLFPGRSLPEEKGRLAVAVAEPSGSPRVPRVSMSFAALARSRQVLFLIGGGRKMDILDDILHGRNCRMYPAARVRAVEEVRWMVVAEAGTSLKGEANGP